MLLREQKHRSLPADVSHFVITSCWAAQWEDEDLVSPWLPHFCMLCPLKELLRFQPRYFIMPESWCNWFLQSPESPQRGHRGVQSNMSHALVGRDGHRQLVLIRAAPGCCNLFSNIALSSAGASLQPVLRSGSYN